MNEKEKKELALSKVMLITLTLAGLGVVVWLGWVRPSDTGIDSFAKCVEAGNPIQESYPEVCVTNEGKRFSNPAQQ